LVSKRDESRFLFLLAAANAGFKGGSIRVTK